MSEESGAGAAGRDSSRPDAAAEPARSEQDPDGSTAGPSSGDGPVESGSTTPVGLTKNEKTPPAAGAQDDSPPQPADPSRPLDDASASTNPVAAEPGPVGADAAASSADESPAPAGETRRERRAREKAEKKRRKAPWWELPALIALAIGIAIVVKSFVVQPFYIPSASMEKTLAGSPDMGHDRILVNKPIYSIIRDPEPGDIVVFNAPQGWDDEPHSNPPSNIVLRAIRGFGQLIGFVPPDGEVLVKRVIAIGGETIKGTADGKVMVSEHGAAGPYRTLDEPYTYTQDPSGPQRVFGPVTVPKGRLWVMGDHRTDSADSRFHCGDNGTDTNDDTNCNPHFSTVPVDDVIGKAFVVAWPPSHWRTLGTPSTFTNAAAAAGPELPATAPLATMVPVLYIRRRRRRRAA